MPNLEQSQANTVTKAYLESLPIETIRVGDVERKCRFDSSTGVRYLLDECGNYTGRSAKAESLVNPEAQKAQKIDLSPKEVPEADPAEEALETPVEDVSNSEEPGPEESAEEPSPNETTPKKRKPFAIIIGIAVALLLVFCIIQAMKIVRVSRPPAGETTLPAASDIQETTDATEEGTIPSTSEAPQSTESNAAHVLTAVNALLPGHVIQEEDLAVVEVSEESFRAVSATGGIYTETELHNLVGLEVAEYIPAGQYLGYQHVTAQYSPANPWGRTEDRQMTVILPINVISYSLHHNLWGNRADIAISIQTKVTTEVPTGGETDSETVTDGLEHHTSVVESMRIDTYTIQAAVIVDTLNQNGESLFTRYSSLATIPAAFRKEMLDNIFPAVQDIEQALPAQIVIAVPAKQAEMLQALDLSAATVEMSQPESSTDTYYQQYVYVQMQQIGKAVANRWAELVQEVQP